jgi:preprotein translocase subunit SecD
MRSLVAVLLGASLLAGCVAREGGTREEDTGTPAGAGELAVPVELRPVLESGSTDPAVVVLSTEDGERLTVAPPVLTLRELDGAEVEFEQNAGTWVVNLDLSDADGTAFGDWTADHVGDRLAMVADERVLMAPEIQSAITAGEIQIAGNYTRDEAQDLLDEITGG